jgi:hypothetical protein
MMHCLRGAGLADTACAFRQLLQRPSSTVAEPAKLPVKLKKWAQVVFSSRPAQLAFTRENSAPGWRAVYNSPIVAAFRQKLMLQLFVAGSMGTSGVFYGCYCLARRRRKKLSSQTMQKVMQLQPPPETFVHPYDTRLSPLGKVRSRLAHGSPYSS